MCGRFADLGQQSDPCSEKQRTADNTARRTANETPGSKIAPAWSNKDGVGGIACGLDLPDTDEFDVPISLNLTVKQTNEMKALLKNRNHYKYVGHSVRFDFLPSRSRKHDPVVFYNLAFRIVRFPVSDTSFETVLTNLDAVAFPPAKLKELYATQFCSSQSKLERQDKARREVTASLLAYLSFLLYTNGC